MNQTTAGFVVDASVTLKWLIEEEGSEAAMRLRDAELAAPALMRIEAANVLRSLVARQEIGASDAVELLGFLQTAPVLIVEHDDALERAALELALMLRHPIYDCIYLALAQRMKRTLVTADKRFIRAIQASGITTVALALAEMSRDAASKNEE